MSNEKLNELLQQISNINHDSFGPIYIDVVKTTQQLINLESALRVYGNGMIDHTLITDMLKTIHDIKLRLDDSAKVLLENFLENHQLLDDSDEMKSQIDNYFSVNAELLDDIFRFYTSDSQLSMLKVKALHCAVRGEKDEYNKILEQIKLEQRKTDRPKVAVVRRKVKRPVPSIQPIEEQPSVQPIEEQPSVQPIEEQPSVQPAIKISPDRIFSSVSLFPAGSIDANFDENHKINVPDYIPFGLIDDGLEKDSNKNIDNAPAEQPLEQTAEEVPEIIQQNNDSEKESLFSKKLSEFKEMIQKKDCTLNDDNDYITMFELMKLAYDEIQSLLSKDQSHGNDQLVSSDCWKKISDILKEIYEVLKRVKTTHQKNAFFIHSYFAFFNDNVLNNNVLDKNKFNKSFETSIKILQAYAPKVENSESLEDGSKVTETSVQVLPSSDEIFCSLSSNISQNPNDIDLKFGLLEYIVRKINTALKYKDEALLESWINEFFKCFESFNDKKIYNKLLKSKEIIMIDPSVKGFSFESLGEHDVILATSKLSEFIDMAKKRRAHIEKKVMRKVPEDSFLGKIRSTMSKIQEFFNPSELDDDLELQDDEIAAAIERWGRKK